VIGWLDLPWLDLPASVRVDILGVLAYGKPAIRIPLRETVTSRVTDVITAVGWSAARDDEYLVASPTLERARHILDVDRSTQPHALELGLLLGYPKCCARAAAVAGEENVDAQAVRLGAACDRVGTHNLDPRGYGEGIALVPVRRMLTTVPPSAAARSAGKTACHGNRAHGRDSRTLDDLAACSRRPAGRRKTRR
jgi:hypothetical protein